MDTEKILAFLTSLCFIISIFHFIIIISIFCPHFLFYIISITFYIFFHLCRYLSSALRYFPVISDEIIAHYKFPYILEVWKITTLICQFSSLKSFRYSWKRSVFPFCEHFLFISENIPSK